jgi:hypothetical protein
MEEQQQQPKQLYQIITRWKPNNMGLGREDLITDQITDDKIVVAQAFECHKEKKEWLQVYAYPQLVPVTQADIVIS